MILASFRVPTLSQGMELQETSCHSLEAARIDDNFDSAFEKKSLFNHFLADTLTPLTTIPVRMYSDTKNNLAGVITDKETLKLVAETFVEVKKYKYRGEL